MGRRSEVIPNNAQIGFNVLSGIGQSGPLTLTVALVQFTAPLRIASTVLPGETRDALDHTKGVAGVKPIPVFLRIIVIVAVENGSPR